MRNVLGVALASGATIATVVGVVAVGSAVGSEDDRAPSTGAADPGAAGAPAVASAALPPVTRGASDPVARSLQGQGIRVSAPTAAAEARTDATALFGVDRSGPGPDRVPDELSLVRMTDSDLGRVLAPDGTPVEQAGPGVRGSVDRSIEDRLVWLAVYRDAEIPAPASPVTGVDDDGQPLPVGDAVGSGTITVDLFVVRDASTGTFLEAGSL